MVHSAPAWALIVYTNFAGVSAVTLNGQFATEPQCEERVAQLPPSSYYWACVLQGKGGRDPWFAHKLFRYHIEGATSDEVVP